jgi:hypothetical protein
LAPTARSEIEPVGDRPRRRRTAACRARVGAAVLQDHGHRRLAVRRLDLAGGDLLPQVGQLGADQVRSTIDGIELLHGREQRGAARLGEAPSVTAARPMRPAIGALTVV